MKKQQKKYLSYSLSAVVVSVLGFFVVTACTDSAKAEKLKLFYKEPSAAGVIATINGKQFTLEDIKKGNETKFQEAEDRLFELTENSIKKKAIEEYITPEANKAKMSLSDYIEKKVIGKITKPSQKEIDAFLKERNVDKSQVNANVEAQVVGYLEMMAKEDKVTSYVAKLSQKSPTLIHIKSPSTGLKLEVGNSPTTGNPNAKVKVFVFSDMQCPYCERAAETVTRLRKEFGKKIEVVFKHLPLPMHPDARPAAEASLCINEQSSDKFWKFHDLAFKNRTKLDAVSLEKYAKEVGANIEKFKECFNSKKFAQAVQDDMNYADKLEIHSTPTFFINGRLQKAGAQSYQTYKEAIEAEL